MCRLKTSCLHSLSGLLVGVIVLTCIISCAQERREEHFYFVQITDTHFEDGDNLDRTRKVVERINDLPMTIECVVHTGDITTNRIEEETLVDSGLSILEELTVPIHYVPGNHDILPSRLESTTRVYVEKFGGLLSRAEYGHVVFIFVYTEPLRESFTIEGYEPLGRLEEYLKESEGKPVIVFHHAPSADDFYTNEFHGGWKDEIRDEWVELINDYNVKAVIAGHFHRDEHHWLGDVPLYVSAPISGTWGRQATFRIYEYNNGKVGYRTQYVR